ncbi:MAG: hypothetical protein J6A28_00035 [Clostridia bacterium]|nr:hypothetical protein [Clostridia bacterium]
MINLPKKFGDMYVKFDKSSGKPLYGFTVKGNTIEKFINFSDSLPQSITLPILNENAYVPAENEYLNFDSLDGTYKNITPQHKEYIQGNIQIASGCFKGIAKVNIVVAQNTSIKLLKDSFDKDAKINLILPQQMTVKRVDSHRKESLWWLLIAKKNLRVSIYENENLFCCPYDNISWKAAPYHISQERNFYVDPRTCEIYPENCIAAFKQSRRPKDILYSFWFFTKEDWRALEKKVRMTFFPKILGECSIYKGGNKSVNSELDEKAYMCFKIDNQHKLVVEFNLKNCQVYYSKKEVIYREDVTKESIKKQQQNKMISDLLSHDFASVLVEYARKNHYKEDNSSAREYE